MVFTCKQLKLLFISNAVLTFTLTSNSIMDIVYHVPVPKATFTQTSRDDRLRIQTLYHHAGFTIDQIVLQLHRFSCRQVKYALQHLTTPRKKLYGQRLFLNTL